MRILSQIECGGEFVGATCRNTIFSVKIWQSAILLLSLIGVVCGVFVHIALVCRRKFIVLHYVFEFFLDFVFGDAPHEQPTYPQRVTIVRILLYHISASLRISLGL